MIDISAPHAKPLITLGFSERRPFLKSDHALLRLNRPGVSYCAQLNNYQLRQDKKILNYYRAPKKRLAPKAEGSTPRRRLINPNNRFRFEIRQLFQKFDEILKFQISAASSKPDYRLPIIDGNR